MVSYKKGLLVSLSVLAADQFAKALARNFLAEPVWILRYTQNTGAAFSLFQGHNTLLAFFALLVIGSLLYFFDRFRGADRLGVALIIGGAAGNLADRLIHGFVIDIIDVGFWPVFNLADASITIGALIIFTASLRNRS